MQKLKIRFENCYGIRKLAHEFDTSEGQAFLVYAPNGAMKTSFARVFRDVATGKQPRDSIFPHRKTTFTIADETDSPIPPDRILVVEPYVEGYSSDKSATLMADQSLRRQYEDLVKSISDKAKVVLGELGKTAGLRRGVEEALTTAFGSPGGDLYCPAPADFGQIARFFGQRGLRPEDSSTIRQKRGCSSWD